jgi:hypothetical protein
MLITCRNAREPRTKIRGLVVGSAGAVTMVPLVRALARSGLLRRRDDDSALVAAIWQPCCLADAALDLRVRALWTRLLPRGIGSLEPLGSVARAPTEAAEAVGAIAVDHSW